MQMHSKKYFYLFEILIINVPLHQILETLKFK
jgi:hypothetical protein